MLEVAPLSSGGDQDDDVDDDDDDPQLGGGHAGVDDEVVVENYDWGERGRTRRRRTTGATSGGADARGLRFDPEQGRTPGGASSLL